jgi:hypothetical protein
MADEKVRVGLNLNATARAKMERLSTPQWL